jgi:hypothetical protein
MSQLVSVSNENPKLLSSELPSSELPPVPINEDEEFPEDPWDEELSELVFDLEATSLKQSGQESSAEPPPTIDFDNATPLQVLERLLDLISLPSNRHYERYGAFATKDTDGLSALVASCLRPEVATLVESHETSSVTKYAQPIMCSLPITNVHLEYQPLAVTSSIVGVPFTSILLLYRTVATGITSDKLTTSPTAYSANTVTSATDAITSLSTITS